MPTSKHVWYTCILQAYLFVIAISNHLCCLLHLHQTRKVVIVVKTGLYQPAVKMLTNICSMQIPDSVVVFICADTLYSISCFCKFYSSIQLTFFGTLIQKSFVLWSNTLSHSFLQYTLAFITSFFEGMFSQSRNCRRIIRYYVIIRSGQKWSGKCMVHGLMDTIPRTKTKTLPLLNLESVIFFMQCIIAKTMWFPTLLLLPS